MRYLILSDIHSNLAALQAALDQVQGDYDQFVCLGDIVGYGPDPNEAIERVRALAPLALVRGNHDKASCGISDAKDFNPAARAAATWTRQQLRPDNLNYLRQLPVGPIRVGSFQIVHGSVLDEDIYVFHAREARECLSAAAVPVTFFGHTHFQGGFLLKDSERLAMVRLDWPPGLVWARMELEPGTKYLINPGSVGQPRDGDPRAGFAFYDDEKRMVEYRRVPYDIKATQEKMRKAGLPTPLVKRLALGR